MKRERKRRGKQKEEEKNWKTRKRYVRGVAMPSALFFGFFFFLFFFFPSWSFVLFPSPAPYFLFVSSMLSSSILFPLPPKGREEEKKNAVTPGRQLGGVITPFLNAA
eukprot:TRINITY_DN2111_c0_g1_i1.p2 TRINITY_DN2111_c0_g1~~TRINITY_DN2111_c0_g1_i1.p2  ORF type:complete len:107 (+),score=19.83 TRINITY_DN2111_c0_g1_i1:25-345(+)